MLSVFLGLPFALAALADPAPTTKHEIKTLPGWTDAQGNPAALPSRQFTGYLSGGTPPSGVGTMYFHYWMIESENDPSNDPVLIWYNGGPGASSLFGLLQEFGTFLLTEESYDELYHKTGIPTPQLNPRRWTLNHTIIAIDSPPPMGLSFCSEAGPGGKPTSCGPWTDKSVFKANHMAHKYLFEEVFPEMKKNPLYFTGESYGGIYIPGFVEEMLNDPVPGLNFQGFAVGDGWTGCAPMPGKPVDWCINLDNVGVFKYPNCNAGPWYDVEFFHGHSQYSNELYDQIILTCSVAELKGSSPLGSDCLSLIDEMAEEVGYFFPYNLYNNCPAGAMRRRLTDTNQHIFEGDHHGINRALRSRRLMGASVTGKKSWSGLSSPCFGGALPDWLLRNDTLKAIGAIAGSSFINLDNGHGFNYTSNEPFVGPIYKHALDSGLKVLVYEGDNDACGLQTSPVEDIFTNLFSEFGMKKTQKWRPWSWTSAGGDEAMGGYVIEYDDRKAQFVSIRGAGHLSPLNRPNAALALMTAFTSGKALPRYAPVPPGSNV